MDVVSVVAPGDLRLLPVEPPRPGEADVVLGVHSVGICGSDLAYVARGGLTGPGTTPLRLGHELSGTVLEVGSAVRAVRVGDRVVLDPLVDFVGNGGSEGGFAETLLVRGAGNTRPALHRLPDGVTLETGALVEPLAVSLHAVRRAGVGPGAKTAVFGAGPIGLGAILMLRWLGVEDVVAIDPSPLRRERALALGAATAIDPTGAETAEAALRRLHGEVPLFRGTAPATTHVIEASGAPQVIPDAVRFLRAGASLCIVSIQKKAVAVEFGALTNKELVITGSLAYPTEIPEVLGMLERGEIDPAPMVSHRFAAAEALDAFATAARPELSGKVLVRYAA